MEIGDLVWDIVQKWDYFPKGTLGFGRYYFREARQFSAFLVLEE